MVYPPISPYKSETLDVGFGHKIYIEQSGTEHGIPVVYLHGGPGGGSSPLFRSLFDPEKYRIITFDQRGCGLSTPFCSVEHNTTEALIADVEYIRQSLHIDKWLVCGGSWGTTLALLYAQAFPERVTGMILRSIFLARQADLAWLYGPEGAARLFPDFYAEFTQTVPNQLNTQSIIEHYWQQLTSNNELQQLQAARAWALWEFRISRLYAQPQLESGVKEKHACLPMALLEAHYFRHDCFIQENQILDNMACLQSIPATLIHGRYDAVCDLNQAWLLHKAWPLSDLQIIPESGHSLAEPSIAHAFARASSKMATFLKQD